MANPFFLSKNYIFGDDTVNVSSGEAAKSYIYDQNRAVQWESIGETTETGYDTSIEVIFYEGSVATDRTIDTIVLQNINLKKFKVQYWTGAAYADIADTIIDTNADSTLRIKLSSSVTTAKIKLLMQSTIVASQEKKVGQFWAMLETFELTEGRHNHERRDNKDGGENYLASGRMTTYTIFKKYAAKINFELITRTSIDLFKTLYDTDDSFVFYMNYAEKIDDIFIVVWKNDFTYSQDTLRGLFKLVMELNEQ